MQLFKRIRPKLRKINPDDDKDEFLEPDEEYSFNVSDFNVSKKEKIKQAKEKIL